MQKVAKRFVSHESRSMFVYAARLARDEAHSVRQVFTNVPVNIEILLGDAGPGILLEVLPCLNGTFMQPLPCTSVVLVALGGVGDRDCDGGQG